MKKQAIFLTFYKSNVVTVNTRVTAPSISPHLPILSTASNAHFSDESYLAWILVSFVSFLCSKTNKRLT